MALAQKIMDRLLELSTALHTAMVGDLDQHRAVIMGTGHAGNVLCCRGVLYSVVGFDLCCEIECV